MTLPWLQVCLLIILNWQLVTSTETGRRVRRNDDVDPLQAVVNKLVQDMTQSQARITALENARARQVAFRATETITHITANVPIPFSLVYNIGNGYDPTKGTFVAPYSGIYVFTFQIFNNKIGDLLVDLMKNDGVAVRMRVYDHDAVTSEASSLTEHLIRGDRVWVRVDHDTDIFSGAHSFFSGALISADV